MTYNLDPRPQKLFHVFVLKNETYDFTKEPDQNFMQVGSIYAKDEMEAYRKVNTNKHDRYLVEEVIECTVL